MKKKWISAMLSLSLVASLAACGGKGEPTPTPPTQHIYSRGLLGLTLMREDIPNP